MSKTLIFKQKYFQNYTFWRFKTQNFKNVYKNKSYWEEQYLPCVNVFLGIICDLKQSEHLKKLIRSELIFHVIFGKQKNGL